MMRAMIFAAGLGTRLRPLTLDRPKAMVEVKGMPLLEIAIRRLKYFGINQIVLNIHHFGELILEFLSANKNFGIDIAISDERDLLLDTGGGLKKAAELLGDAPFLVHNVDVISNLDLQAFYDFHIKSRALATLALRKRESSRYLLFDKTGQLSGWRNAKTGERKICRKATAYEDYAFSGIHVIDPRIFDFMPDEKIFSIIDVYLKAGKSEVIQGYPHTEGIWLDVGKLPAVEKAEEVMKEIRII